MSPVSKPLPALDGQFLGIREAVRKSGRSPAFIQRAAILGRVRVKLEPGVPPAYSADDIAALDRPRAQ